MQEVIMTVKNRVQPDGALWSLWNSNDRLIQKGTSTIISSSPTVRGNKYVLGCDTPQLHHPDLYDLVVTMDIQGTQYSHSKPILIEPQPGYDPGTRVTMEKTLTLTSPVTGTANFATTNKTINIYNVVAGQDFTIDFSNVTQTVQLPVYYYGTNTVSLLPSLTPMYLYYDGTDSAGYKSHETLRIFYVTPSIMSAIDELRKFVDRINMKYRIDSLHFTDGDYLDMLSAGMDMFNGIGLATYFTMAGASGPIRSFWIACAEWWTLSTRYLEEGLTSYTYSGSAVSLDIDVTQYLEAQLDRIGSYIFDKLPDFKIQLWEDQNTSGDGTYGVGNRAPGSIGISFGPVCHAPIRRF